MGLEKPRIEPVIMIYKVSGLFTTPGLLLYELKREWFKYCSMTHIVVVYAHVV